MASVDFRYARALALVVSDHKLDPGATEAQLKNFADILAQSAELREVLDNPSIPESQKVGVLNALGDRVGLSPVVRNFLAVVARHGRTHQLPDIIQSFSALADNESEIAEVEIASANPLDDASRKLLEDQASRLAGGKRIRPTFREDPSLLGGAIVKIGSTVYDGSVRAQLEQLRERLVTAGTR